MRIEAMTGAIPKDTGTGVRRALAGAVRRERLGAGLTQAEMARRMDVDHQTVWRWESGRKDGRQALLRCWRGGEPTIARMAGRILMVVLATEERARNPETKETQMR